MLGVVAGAQLESIPLVVDSFRAPDQTNERRTLMSKQDEGRQAARAEAARQRAAAAERGEIRRVTWTADGDVEHRHSWDGNLPTKTTPSGMIDNWGSSPDPASSSSGSSPGNVPPAAEQPSSDAQAGQDSDGH
jgi:hypothetical protein